MAYNKCTMRIIIISTMLLTLGAGCVSPSVSNHPLPETFWGYGSWSFDTQEERLSDGASGTAIIKLQFTRVTGDQYEIFGDVTYVEDTMRCDNKSVPNRICPTDRCSYVSSDPGTIAGVAEVSDGVLTLKPVWNGDDIPSERVLWICDESEENPEHDTTAVRTTMDIYGAGFVNTVWTMDVDGITFIDDLPPGEVVDTKTAFKNFETEAGLIKAEGLFALYRNEPK